MDHALCLTLPVRSASKIFCLQFLLSNTEAVRAEVKKMVAAGKTGSEIAKISVPSVRAALRSVISWGRTGYGFPLLSRRGACSCAYHERDRSLNFESATPVFLGASPS